MNIRKLSEDSQASTSRSTIASRRFSSREFPRVSEEWIAHCEPWLNEEGGLYERQDISTPPLKDFYALWVDPYQITFTVWEIKSHNHQSHGGRRGAYSMHADYETFKTDVEIRGAIQRRTQPGELDFIDNLLCGRINFLDRLSEKVQMRIFKYLDVKSVVSMSKTSRHYKTLCYSETIWSSLYACSDLKNFMTAGLLDLNKEEGWRHVYIMATRIKKSVQAHVKVPSVTDLTVPSKSLGNLRGARFL